MTAPQIVVASAAATVAVSIALICVGVAIIVGVGWSLITAGALIGPSATAAAVALLRDGTTG